jgi:hypothetical protein
MNCTHPQCTNRLTLLDAYTLPLLRVVNADTGVFGYGLFNTSPLAKNCFLGNVYGEVLSRSTLANRKHPPMRSFVLDYRYHNLCLDLTWSSNQFCHLSHSCNANARLELWHLGAQPTWKVFTNCDIPSQHFITIDFRAHNLPRPYPCQCTAPTCSSTTAHPTLCEYTSYTHPSRTQTSLDTYLLSRSSPSTTACTKSTPAPLLPSPSLSQSRLTRFYLRSTTHSLNSSAATSHCSLALLSGVNANETTSTTSQHELCAMSPQTIAPQLTPPTPWCSPPDISPLGRDG